MTGVSNLRRPVNELAEHALDSALAAGAGYADARVVQRRAQHVSTKNGEVDSVSDAETEGIGVRVLVDGAWGFAGDPRLSEEGARDAALRAVAFARASASRARTRVELASVPPGHRGVRARPSSETRSRCRSRRRSPSACAPRRACAGPR